MLEEILIRFGYLGLFFICFLAATLVPLSSEVFVALASSLGYDNLLILVFATTGNYLGSLTSYYAGKKGNDFILSRYIYVKPERLQRTQFIYERWGTPILFFSWAPIIGDVLSFLSGILKVNLLVFTFWVVLGKFFRYAVILGTLRIILTS
jgi:membrane protein YqaA with SNARE-associated domain